jgi:hypothetical protein
MVTETETATWNLSVGNNGNPCPGPALMAWARDIQYNMNVLGTTTLAGVMQGELPREALEMVSLQYLLIAYRVGYEAGKSRREFVPCPGGTNHDHGDRS